MRKHKYEKLIDDYLLNKLSKETEEQFEKHYFTCPSCFKKLKDREEFIAAIKQVPDFSSNDLKLKKKSRIELFLNRISTLLSFKQWTGAAVSTALLLIIILIILPKLEPPLSQFVLESDAVRGRSITIIADTAPNLLKWKSIGENIEYNISVYNNELIWEETTPENSIFLPDEIIEQMSPEVKYFWQIKAYSQEGTLIAKSGKNPLTLIKK